MLTFRISLREQDTKQSYKTITLPTTQNKTKQINAIRLESWITWMNHFKQYIQTSLSNVLMSIWQSPNYVPVSCPNIIKFYNNNIDGVDIMNKKIAAYRLDLKSKYCFYLSMFFLSHGCHTFKQSYCLHETWWWHIVTNFKIVVAKALIGRWSHHNGLFSTTRLSKQKFHEPSMTRAVPIRTPEFQ